MTAQQEEMQTLFSHKKKHNGFYIAPSMKFSAINGQTAFIPTIKGGWIINRSIVLGLSGSGLAPTIQHGNIVANQNVRPMMGYDGLLNEPIISSYRLVQISIPLVMFGGLVGYVEDLRDQDQVDNDNPIDEQTIWVATLGAMAELNVTRFFRLSTGISYRLTQEVDLINTDPNAFQNWNYEVTFKFGRF
ncbi:MAG: hypothetical protein ACFB0B_02745, partial [Thermonemataceae bacterium]